MSYSFHVRGATKTAVMDAATVELDKVVAAQPIHAADRDAALSAVKAFLSLIPDADPTEEYAVYLSGSVSSKHDGTLYSASVNTSASLSKKQ